MQQSWDLRNWLALLAAAGRNGRIRVYRTTDGHTLRDVAVHRQRIRALAFASDGIQLVSAGEDQANRVQDIQTGEETTLISTGRTKIFSLAICSKDRVVTGGTDNLIRLWDLNTKQPIETLAGRTGSVCSLASQGDFLVSGSFDTTSGVWSFPRSGTIGRSAAG